MLVLAQQKGAAMSFDDVVPGFDDDSEQEDPFFEYKMASGTCLRYTVAGVRGSFALYSLFVVELTLPCVCAGPWHTVQSLSMEWCKSNIPVYTRATCTLRREMRCGVRRGRSDSVHRLLNFGRVLCCGHGLPEPQDSCGNAIEC